MTVNVKSLIIWLELSFLEADLPDFFPLELDLALPPLALSDDLLLLPLDLSDDFDLLLFVGGDLGDLLPAPDLDLADLPVLLLLLLVVFPVGDAARLPGEDRAPALLWDDDLALPPCLDDDLALPPEGRVPTLLGGDEVARPLEDVLACLRLGGVPAPLLAPC